MHVEFRLSKHQGLQDTWQQLLTLLTKRKMEVTSSHLRVRATAWDAQQGQEGNMETGSSDV